MPGPAGCLLIGGGNIQNNLAGTWNLNGTALTSVPDLKAAVAAADLVILVQNHRSYAADDLAERAQQFLDTRGVTTTSAAVRL